MFVDGPALWVNGKEVLHADASGSFDVRLTRQVIRELKSRLKADERVHLRPSTSSDWIEVELRGPDDEPLLLELAQRAVEAHRPPPGTSSQPAPTGAALARRQRFH